MTTTKIATASLAIAATLFLVAYLAGVQLQQARAAEFAEQSMRSTAHASTTAYALTWGAVATRIVATSTFENATSLLPVTVGRTALTLQAVNCVAGGQIWLRFNDVPAATPTGDLPQTTTTL